MIYVLVVVDKKKKEEGRVEWTMECPRPMVCSVPEEGRPDRD